MCSMCIIWNIVCSVERWKQPFDQKYMLWKNTVFNKIVCVSVCVLGWIYLNLRVSKYLNLEMSIGFSKFDKVLVKICQTEVPVAEVSQSLFIYDPFKTVLMICQGHNYSIVFIIYWRTIICINHFYEKFVGLIKKY